MASVALISSTNTNTTSTDPQSIVAVVHEPPPQSEPDPDSPEPPNLATITTVEAETHHNPYHDGDDPGDEKLQPDNEPPGDNDRDDGIELDLAQVGDLTALFAELADLLTFEHAKVRSDCIEMIARLLPQLAADELEPCAALVLPDLVRNLCHPDRDVGQAAIDTLLLLLRVSDDGELTMRALVDTGLRHDDPAVRRTVAESVVHLFIDDLAGLDWGLVLNRLILLVVLHDEAEPEAVQALQRLRALVGDERFQRHLREMEGEERRQVGRFLSDQRRLASDGAARLRSSTPPVREESGADLDFVDAQVLQMLRDEQDWRLRVQGIEQLRFTVRNLPNVNALLAQMDAFLTLLDDALRDANFKVTLVALDIYGVTIERLAWRVRPHLGRIVGSLVRHLGENRVAVRAFSTRVLTALMHGAGPAAVVDALCRHLVERGRTAQAREEILNLVTVALLTFPSYEFRLRDVCGAVAPALLDSRRRLRQAALECLAVLTQAMGPAKLSAVASAVDEAAATATGVDQDVEGALAAVLARLARRQLPRVAADGTVEYSLRVPSSRGSGGSNGSTNGRSSRISSHGIISNFPQGADIDWILAGSGSLGSGSAQSRSGSRSGVGGAASPVPPPGVANSGIKPGPASFPGSPSAPRRIVSPGQGKNWLPWSEMGGLVPGCNSGGSLPDAVSTSHRTPSRADWNVPATPSRVMRPNTRAFEELAVSQTGGASWTDPSDEYGLGYHPAANGNHQQHHQQLHNHQRHPVTSQHYPSGGQANHQQSGSFYGKTYTGRPPTTDRRPLDKVAAMLGNNILPSKLRPDNDAAINGHRDKSGRHGAINGAAPTTTVVPLHAIIPYTPSSTWPGPAAGTVSLPSLPQRRKVLGPIHDASRDAPVPTRPTLARSNSGSKRSRVPPIGQSQLYGGSGSRGDSNNEDGQHQQSRQPRERGGGSMNSNKPVLSQTDSGLESSLNAASIGDSPAYRRRVRAAPDSDRRHQHESSAIGVSPANGAARESKDVDQRSRQQHEIRSEDENDERRDSDRSVSDNNVARRRRHHRPTAAEDDEEDENEYPHAARGSVDSGVASRPRSRASSRALAARPVSLDLETVAAVTTSTVPATTGPALQPLERVASADSTPSSSDDEEDDDDDDWCTEDEGIRNRALSQVSSYSSLDNYRDEVVDPANPTASVAPASSHGSLRRSSTLRLDAPDDENDSDSNDEEDGTFGRIVPPEVAATAVTSNSTVAEESLDDGRVNETASAIVDGEDTDLLVDTADAASPRRIRRKHSSLSWDMSPPTPLAARRHRLRRTSSLSLGTTTEDEEGRRAVTKIIDTTITTSTTKKLLSHPVLADASLGDAVTRTSPSGVSPPPPLVPPPDDNSDTSTVTNPAPTTDITAEADLERDELDQSCLTNGLTLIPRARSNEQVFVSCSPDQTPTVRRDINVVGKGMLPHHEANIYTGTHLTSPNSAMPDNSPLPVAPGSPTLPTVQGRSLQHDAVDDNLSNDEEDPYSMSLSRSTFNKMMSRKMEMMKEAERRKYERQQRLQEQRRSWLQEQDQTKKGDQEDRLSIRNGQVGLIAKTPPGGKPPAAKRRMRNGVVSGVTNGVSPSAKTTSSNHSRASEAEDRLLRNPEDAVRTALKNIDSDEWNVKCEGIKILTGLCHRSPGTLNNDLHNINLALLPEVRNLRSTVSRAAIQCYAELFATTKKNMEPDLELICKTLLHKSGESNVFIKEDVEKSLVQMVETMVPQKTALALILGGANHRNAAVRKTTAQFLAGVCEKMGPNRILSGAKDVTDRILPTAAQFVMDGSPMTRFYGRKIFFMLLGHPEFDKIIRQHIPQNTIRNIQEILEGLKTKGLGAIPNESSASSRQLKGSNK